MIYILLGQPKSIKKNSFQATTFKVEENSRTFQGKMEFKDFSRTFQDCKPCNHSLRFTGKLTFGRLDRLPHGLCLAKSTLASVTVRKM